MTSAVAERLLGDVRDAAKFVFGGAEIVDAGRVAALRIFFRDLQEWEFVPRRFDPMRHLTTPKSLLALIEPKQLIVSELRANRGLTL